MVAMASPIPREPPTTTAVAPAGVGALLRDVPGATPVSDVICWAGIGSILLYGHGVRQHPGGGLARSTRPCSFEKLRPVTGDWTKCNRAATVASRRPVSFAVTDERLVTLATSGG